MPEHHFRHTHFTFITEKKVPSINKIILSQILLIFTNTAPKTAIPVIYHVFPRSSQSYDSDVSLLASEVKESVSLPTKKQNSYTFVLSPPAASRHFDTKRKRTIF